MKILLMFSNVIEIAFCECLQFILIYVMPCI